MSLGQCITINSDAISFLDLDRFDTTTGSAKEDSVKNTFSFIGSRYFS